MMNISKRSLGLALTFTMAALAATGSASARQLGNGGTTYSGLWSKTRPEEFLGKFIEVAQADLTANAALLSALGVADAARPSASALQTLDMKATTSDIANAASAANATHQLVTQTLAGSAPLSDSSKTSFAAGALALAQATRNLTDLTKNIGATKQALVTAGAPARVALYAARNAPDLAAQMRAEVKAVVEYASAHQIALAPEVTEVAASM